MTDLQDYQKKKIVLRGLMEGRRYYTAIKAMNFAEKIHNGERKDGSHEFSHQVEMALHAWCLIDSIQESEQVLICIFFHDSIEDDKITYEEIQSHFGTTIADRSLGMSKIRNGKRIPNDVYYQTMAQDPVLAFAKGIDRAHNLGTMRKAFNDHKQLQYLTEARNYTLPMLKEARRSFPEMINAFEAVKHTIVLLCDLTEHFIQRIPSTDAAETLHH